MTIVMIEVGVVCMLSHFVHQSRGVTPYRCAAVPEHSRISYLCSVRIHIHCLMGQLHYNFRVSLSKSRIYEKLEAVCIYSDLA